MSTAIEIPKGTRDAVLVFSLKMPAEQVRFLNEEPGAIEQVLGIPDTAALAERDQVEVFDVSDLEDLGLLGYLGEGLGVKEADLSQYGMALDNLTGPVLVLRARAFGGAHATLTPADTVQLVAYLGETKTDWTAPPLTTESAKPRLSQAPRAARNRARRIGATLFAIVMGLLFLLIYILAF